MSGEDEELQALRNSFNRLRCDTYALINPMPGSAGKRSSPGRATPAALLPMGHEKRFAGALLNPEFRAHRSNNKSPASRRPVRSPKEPTEDDIAGPASNRMLFTRRHGHLVSTRDSRSRSPPEPRRADHVRVVGDSALKEPRTQTTYNFGDVAAHLNRIRQAHGHAIGVASGTGGASVTARQDLILGQAHTPAPVTELRAGIGARPIHSVDPFEDSVTCTYTTHGTSQLQRAAQNLRSQSAAEDVVSSSAGLKKQTFARVAHESRRIVEDPLPADSITALHARFRARLEEEEQEERMEPDVGPRAPEAPAVAAATAVRIDPSDDDEDAVRGPVGGVSAIVAGAAESTTRVVDPSATGLAGMASSVRARAARAAGDGEEPPSARGAAVDVDEEVERGRRILKLEASTDPHIVSIRCTKTSSYIRKPEGSPGSPLAARVSGVRRSGSGDHGGTIVRLRQAGLAGTRGRARELLDQRGNVTGLVMKDLGQSAAVYKSWLGNNRPADTDDSRPMRSSAVRHETNGDRSRSPLNYAREHRFSRPGCFACGLGEDPIDQELRLNARPLGVEEGETRTIRVVAQPGETAARAQAKPTKKTSGKKGLAPKQTVVRARPGDDDDGPLPNRARDYMAMYQERKAAWEAEEAEESALGAEGAGTAVVAGGQVVAHGVALPDSLNTGGLAAVRMDQVPPEARPAEGPGPSTRARADTTMMDKMEAGTHEPQPRGLNGRSMTFEFDRMEMGLGDAPAFPVAAPTTADPAPRPVTAHGRRDTSLLIAMEEGAAASEPHPATMNKRSASSASIVSNLGLGKDISHSTKRRHQAPEGNTKPNTRAQRASRKPSLHESMGRKAPRKNSGGRRDSGGRKESKQAPTRGRSLEKVVVQRPRSQTEMLEDMEGGHAPAGVTVHVRVPVGGTVPAGEDTEPNMEAIVEEQGVRVDIAAAREAREALETSVVSNEAGAADPAEPAAGFGAGVAGTGADDSLMALIESMQTDQKDVSDLDLSAVGPAPSKDAGLMMRVSAPVGGEEDSDSSGDEDGLRAQMARQREVTAAIRRRISQETGGQ